MYSGDPADGATTRKNRMVDMLRYSQQWMPEGVTEQQLMAYMRRVHGLTARKAAEYVHEQITDGMLKPIGSRLFLDESTFGNYLDLLGFNHPAVQVMCIDCGAIYSSRVSNCPGCGSAARTLWTEDVQAAKTPAPPTCPKCGAILVLEDQKFCGYCGQKLREDDA